MGEWLRSDARGCGAGVAIGGWECFGQRPCSDSRWFMCELTPMCAPWAFSRGDPSKVIASLELLVTLVSVMAFVPSFEAMAIGSMRLTGATENQGAVEKLMTSKFPVCCVRMVGRAFAGTAS